MDFLKKYNSALSDPDLTGNPINIESRMDDWIKKSHLGCKTCRQNRKPHLADVLDN
jgi:hypothetical protein